MTTSLRFCRAVSGVLQDEGFEVLTAPDGETALKMVAAEAPDLVLLDIALPGLDGLEALTELKRQHPLLPVIMVSAYGSVENAVKATRLGAFDFIEKPPNADKILLSVRNALENARLAEENRRLRQQRAPVKEIIGESAAIRRLREKLALVAPTNAAVLISGENGTGKELVARALHAFSRRAHQPLVEVNCAAIPEDLIESELFGHEKGAFTGASSQHRGKFDLAHEGTLFLDEIGDMSLKTQAKILRILEEQRFERVGGGRPIQVDVRVLAATNKNLEEEIVKGRFREDLYHRINVIPLSVPPLRERREDIPLLAAHFLQGALPGERRPGQDLHPRGPGGPGRHALAGERPGAEELRLPPGHPQPLRSGGRGRPAPGRLRDGAGGRLRLYRSLSPGALLQGGPGPLREAVLTAQIVGVPGQRQPAGGEDRPGALPPLPETEGLRPGTREGRGVKGKKGKRVKVQRGGSRFHLAPKLYLGTKLIAKFNLAGEEGVPKPELGNQT